MGFLWTPILNVLGPLKTFLGSRSDLVVFHTMQPKKAFVLHQEIQPLRAVPAGRRGHGHQQMLTDKCQAVPELSLPHHRGEDGWPGVTSGLWMNFLGFACDCHSSSLLTVALGISFQWLWASHFRNYK